MHILKFICLVFILSVSHASEQDQVIPHLPKSKTITISGHPDYPPIIWVSGKGKKLKGIAVEAVQKIFSKIGVKVKIVPISTWARAQEQVRLGKVDMLLPPYKSKKREKIYSFVSTPFMMDDTVLFTAKGKDLHFEKLTDLRQYFGVAIINDSFGDDFDKADKKYLKVQRLIKTDQSFKFVLKGRADYLIAGYNAGISVATQMGITDKIDYHRKPVITTGMYLAISKRSKWNKPQIIDYLNREITELVTNSYFKSLEPKYFKQHANEK